MNNQTKFNVGDKVRPKFPAATYVSGTVVEFLDCNMVLVNYQSTTLGIRSVPFRSSELELVEVAR